MPIQDFTDNEKQILQSAASELLTSSDFAAIQLNMTKAEQKAAHVDKIDLQVAQLQAKIDNVDLIVAGIKTQILTECNTKKAVLLGLKAKILDTPE